MYYVKDGGILTCLDLVSDKQVSRIRTGGRGIHYVSSFIAGDRLFVFSGDGRVTVPTLEAIPEIVTKNDLADDISATPAIVDGVTYIRTHSGMWAFGET